MKVLLTFDVEVWCNGWDRLDEVFPHHFDRYVYGRSAQGQFALPKTLEILAAHGLKGVFFIEPLFAARFGVEHLATIVNLVRQAGQDVQLHLHPEWVDEIRPGLIADCAVKRQHLSYYTLDEQVALIRTGRELIEQAGGGRCDAFRAGSFACNRDSYRALAANGIGIDSSLNEHYAVSGPDLRGQADFVDLSTIEGVVSHPVGLYIDGFGRLRPAQLSGSSFVELRQALQAAAELGRSEYVIVSHNFEMLRPGRSDPDSVVVRRFTDLCRFLRDNRASLPTGTFDAGTAGAAQRFGSSRQPAVGRAATLVRHAEQLRRRLRDRA